jgi:hypothetical protein
MNPTGLFLAGAYAAHKQAFGNMYVHQDSLGSPGESLLMIFRSRLLLVAPVFILVVVVGLFVSLHSEALDIDLSSHAESPSEYVKQFFNKPANTTEIFAEKYIAPDAVRIYIGIVLLPRPSIYADG